MVVVAPWPPFEAIGRCQARFVRTIAQSCEQEDRVANDDDLPVAVLCSLAATAESRDRLVARDLREGRKGCHDLQLHPPFVDAQLVRRGEEPGEVAAPARDRIFR